MDDLISRQDLIDRLNGLMKSPWFLDGYVGLKDMAESKLNEFQIIDRLKWDERKNAVVIVRDFCVRGTPAVPAVPVKHGKWVMDEDPHDGDVRCSVCLIAIDQMHERNHGLLNALTGGKWYKFYRYCPNCGAKMDLEDEQ